MVFQVGHLGGAELDDVGDQLERGARRVDEGAAGGVLLEDVVLHRAAEPVPGHPLLLGHHQVEGEEDRRRGVDGHRGGHPVERDAGQEAPHVLDRVDRHPHPPDLAAGHRIVGVVADLGGEVEGHRQTGRPLLEQVAVAAVGLRGAGVAGVLAHGPQAPAVHVRVETAGEREVAGIADRRRVVEAGDVVRPIGGTDGDAGGGGPLLLGRFALGRRRHSLGLLGLGGHAGIIGLARGGWCPVSA